ncbi:helix-turn-helix domain-containing protein [Rhodococcus sp. NCIMB 12038]|uniref:helix-turn-helix domain-containing protein n=1 Tax=Rhodococcus sp. NCIMB 12038 TaxID=933800 RepID=UPI0015C6228C|nr:helix-turn-helix transcriptional regulator [Rhodococcus sp. NCIMB 12038]
MGKHAIAMGPVGRLVATNLVARRGALGMTQTQLSEAVTLEGRRLGRQAITEIETCRRRIDVDDLSALARALQTTVAHLMGEVSDTTEGDR